MTESSEKPASGGEAAHRGGPKQRPDARARLRRVAVLAAVVLTLPLSFAFRTSRAEEAVGMRSAPPASTARKPPDPTEYCMQRFLRPFAETAGVELPATKKPAPAPAASSAGPPEAPAPPERWDAALETTLSALRGAGNCSMSLEVIVATVADPIESGLGYQFDTSLQALRLGVEHDLGGDHGRFYRDRSWLPWDDRDAGADKAADSAECRRSLPGVVLFRGSHPKQRRLLSLLLVGETPISGVQMTAMLRALSIADRIARAGAGCPVPSSAHDRLRIVGPSFSGSVQSLRAALTRFAELEPKNVRPTRVITGSATGGALKDAMRFEPDATQAGAGAKPIEFFSTTASESAVHCAYLRYLRFFLDYGADQPANAQRTLPGVALLHESGTEFGAALQGTKDCPYSAAVDISFPAHVSLLRDAYEDMDRKNGPNTEQEAIARRTTLAVSLREKRRPLTLEAEPSPKTTFAQDVVLSNVLGAISRGAVRHVGVQATDVADAIFLARRIRDVSPDVRLAFFASDVLLLHPEFRRDLKGSLVVSPYPFLGSTDIASSFSGRKRPRSHQGFENGASLGIFNAVLATRGAKARDLLEYTFTSEHPPLPIWISAIGANRLVPISLYSNQDKHDIVYPGRQAFEAELANAKRGASSQASNLRPWQRLQRSELGVENDVHIPRFWHFVYALLILVFLIDRLLQRRSLKMLSPVKIPDRLGRREDRDADLAIVRTKWRLYAAIRTYTLAFGLGYMGLVYCLAFFTYWPSGTPPLLGTLVVALVVLGAIGCAAYDAREFAVDYTALGRSVGGRSPTVWLSRVFLGFRDRRNRAASSRRPAPQSNEQSIDSALEEDPVPMDGWDRVSLPFGFARPEGRIPAARTSFAQLRLLANVALCVALAFTIGQFLVIFEDAIPRLSAAHPIPRSTLLALRSLPIVNTVSPAAPTLWCVIAVYVWCVGRMARLRLVSALSRISPDDGVADLVSTPLRVILHPGHGYGRKTDDSFTRVERRALNAIVRPTTGPNYFLALLAIVIVPVGLFTLKPPSTLERPATTLLLVGGLALSVVLIGNTLIQFIQHWIALELLLKRIFQHRLGRAFDRVAGFVRDTVHQQLSRAPHDLLRLAGCAQMFDQLVRSGQELGEHGLAEDERQDLARRNASMQVARSEALSASTLRDVAGAATFEADLGKSVLEAARDVMRLLLRAWAGQLSAPPVSEDNPATPARERKPVDPDELTGDALSAVAFHYSKLEFRWLRDAEAFVATVVALLIHRHVRQVQHFMYALTTCALLLLFAVSSYPFEPHRLLLTFIWVIVGAVALVGLFVYVELDRNALISRLAGTTAGRMTFDGAFALRVFAWVIIPLLGVAAAQYPDLANALFSVVEPFARALR